MEMAREAGLLFNEKAGTEAAHAIHHERLQRFFNAILERAAVELSTYGVIQDMGGADAAEIVRSLKLPTN